MGKSSVGSPDSVPSPIDVHVGARIRQRRTALGMSQEKLGDALNLTFQQIQKYERGANRVGASRLYDLCRVFDVTADFFFEGLPNFEPAHAFPAAGQTWQGQYAMAEKQEAFGLEDPASRETAELVRAFGRITDPKVRERILDLVKSLAPAAKP
ncbi:MAG: helix-turn-helix transcriptional regulator [Proteobacteria bacterium]|nr:helix-turn-helix transcriptional regulator [Pseudomonadota bacterium]